VTQEEPAADAAADTDKKSPRKAAAPTRAPMPPLVPTLKRGVFSDNPLLIQVLGVCSALAVTNRMDKTIAMCGALVFVAAFSCLGISLLRNLIPKRVRMITFMVVISTFVIVVDQYLKAYWFTLSKDMGPYVGLIITNCIIMGRCEIYAARNRPLPAVLDGIGNAAGYGLVLCTIALVREPLGSGTLFGYAVLPAAFEPCTLMALAPGAFFAMGVLVWIVRSKWPLAEDAQPRP
jgi:Na+-transporting NADH:ubiquinone oxidoreductase subunit D